MRISLTPALYLIFTFGQLNANPVEYTSIVWMLFADTKLGKYKI